MLDLFKLYNLVCATVNTAQNGHMRPQRNFIDWVNEISTELFNELADDWEKANKISDLLYPFLVTVNAVVNPNPGFSYDVIMLPQDYGRYSSARRITAENSTDSAGLPCKDLPILDGSTGKCSTWNDEDELAKKALEQGASSREYPVHKVDNQRFGGMMKHKLLGPTPSRPYITQDKIGFKVAPRGMGVIVLDYLKKPVTAVFAYTIVGDQIQYDESGSVQLDWPDAALPMFVSRLKKRYGSFTDRDNIYAQATAEQAKTSA